MIENFKSNQDYLSANAIEYAKFYSRSHDAVIRVFDEVGNVIDTHEHDGREADVVRPFLRLPKRKVDLLRLVEEGSHNS